MGAMLLRDRLELARPGDQGLREGTRRAAHERRLGRARVGSHGTRGNCGGRRARGVLRPERG
eukprot:6425022-Alexandrium_andersonii.AAC.1